MTDQATIVRERMRAYWGTTCWRYAEHSAPQTARLSEPLLALVPPAPGERVLDVATGTGVLAIRAGQAVGPTGAVLATDLVSEWGEIVAAAAEAAGVGNVTFRAMSAEEITLPDASFDVVYCQLGLMFVADRPRALGEMRRVLRNGGRLGVAVWSTADRVPCFESNRLVGAIVPPLPGDELMPTPLSLGEPGLIERLVAEAGFRDVVSQRRIIDFEVGDPEEHWQYLTSRPDRRLADALAALSDDERVRLHDDLIASLERYRDGDVVRFPNEAIFVRAARRG